jgi:hypothetical protein
MMVMRLGTVVHVYNPSIQEAEAGRCEFKASLGCVARPCLKIKKMMVLLLEAGSIVTSVFRRKKLTDRAQHVAEMLWGPALVPELLGSLLLIRTVNQLCVAKTKRPQLLPVYRERVYVARGL